MILKHRTFIKHSNSNICRSIKGNKRNYEWHFELDPLFSWITPMCIFQDLGIYKWKTNKKRFRYMNKINEVEWLAWNKDAIETRSYFSVPGEWWKCGGETCACENKQERLLSAWVASHSNAALDLKMAGILKDYNRSIRMASSINQS